MSKESKIFTPKVWSTQETIAHYESFGWELISINGKQILMSRETQNPVYVDLVKYQSIYEETLEEYNNLRLPIKPTPPPEGKISTYVLTFVLLIVPGVFYVRYKRKQKREYKEKMQKFNAEYANYLSKRKELLDKCNETAIQSRAVFFSKQG